MFYAIVLMISAVTNVFSFIVGMIASVAAMYFIEQMASSDYIGGESFNINIDGLTADYVRNFALDAEAGPQTPEQEASPEGIDWSEGLTMFGFLFGYVAAQATMLSMALKSLPIKLFGVCSLVTGILGTIIGTSIIFNGPCEHLAAFIALELSMFSVGMGALDLRGSSGAALAFDITAIITGIFGVICSLGSLYLEDQ